MCSDRFHPSIHPSIDRSAEYFSYCRVRLNKVCAIDAPVKRNEGSCLQTVRSWRTLVGRLIFVAVGMHWVNSVRLRNSETANGLRITAKWKRFNYRVGDTARGAVGGRGRAVSGATAGQTNGPND
jgi:hypothetical protein